MRESRIKKSWLHGCGRLVGLFALAACNWRPAPPTATAAMAQPTATRPTPTATQPFPSATWIQRSPQAATIEDRPLSTAGPWLLSDDRGLAANPDGTGLTRLFVWQPGMILHRRSDTLEPTAGFDGYAASPHGGFYSLAYELDGEPYLAIVSIPARQVVRTIALLSSSIEYPSANTCYDPTRVGEAAWSPDGTLLAFTAAIQGLTADVYLYSIETDRISRLTDGSSQAAYLSWSPDGKYILNIGVDCWATGFGQRISAVWAVTRDGEATELYRPSDLRRQQDDGGWFTQDSTGEVLIGWLGASVFATYSAMSGGGCYGYNLRSFDIAKMEEHIYWADCFQFLLGQELLNPTFVIQVVDPASEGEDQRAGLFLVSSDRSVRLLDTYADAGFPAIWNATLGYYFLYGEPLSAFRPNGQWVDLPEKLDFVPAYVLSNNVWVAQDGEYLPGPEANPRRLTAGSYRATRVPGTDDFLMCTDHGLFLVLAPDYQPRLVRPDDLCFSQVIWP
jgi:hypothetical protein